MSITHTSPKDAAMPARRHAATARRAGCGAACRSAGAADRLRLRLPAGADVLGTWELCVGCRRVSLGDGLRRLHDERPDDASCDALLAVADRALIGGIARSALRDRRCEAFDCEFVLGESSEHGEHRQVRAHTLVLRDAAGRPVYLVGSLREVTSQRRQSREQARQHDILRIALSSLGAGIVTTDTDGRVQWMNPVAERMLDRHRAEVQGRPLEQVILLADGEDPTPLVDSVRQCLHHGRVMGLGGDALLVPLSDGERALECEVRPIRDEHGETYGCVLVLHDVTEGRARSRELSYLAAHDQLTGLINRREFENRLRVLNERAHDAGNAHSVLVVDLDRFKPVNDRGGHAAGDELLRSLAQLLRHSLRDVDTVARIGGDEFAVILTHCPAQQGVEIARQLCAAIGEFRFRYADETFTVGASIGMAVIDGGWQGIEELLRAADAACYRAKQAGRGCVRLGRHEDVELVRRVSDGLLPDTVRRALDEDRFRLFAQRIQTLERTGDTVLPRYGACCEAEILLRLIEPNGEVLPPGAFLPAAERGNLMPRVDRWVIDRVLRWLSRASGLERVDRLWINLSGRSLADVEFAPWLLRSLDALGAARRARLCFELDELVAVNNLAETARLFGALRERDVAVALDRFGAGAASYGYLKSLQVDYIKIDRQFVRGLGREPLNLASVRCFVEIATLLGIRTIAGFVETEEELALLTELGVDRAQGVLLHEATPLEEVFSRHDDPLAAIA